MAKQVKLGILRAHHDSSYPTIPDAACIEMMMTSSSRRSVFDYWRDNTDGYLDFRDSALFPWVEVTLAPGDMTSRSALATKAYEATKLLPGSVLNGFDGFVVLIHPGFIKVPNPDANEPDQPATINQGFDAGAGFNLGGKPGCSLSVMTGDHTFFCHEIGHVLGFGHSYGVWNNGIDWDGKPPWSQGQVYGDPYDLMSSATFGTRASDESLPTWKGSPTFIGTIPVGWPNQGAASMGPAPARAHIHQWDAQALQPGTVRHLPYPIGAAVHRVRLVGAGRNSRGTSLIVLHPDGEDNEGRFRCYVEYRSKDGWDVGLHESTADLARRAVVVHTLSDAVGDGVRCWYRGHILVPLETDTDLAPAFTPLVVRVVDVNEDAGVVEIEIGTSSPREVEIHARHFKSLLATSDEHTVRTPCGDDVVSATRIWQTTSLYRASTRGYGGTGAPGVVNPMVSWTVAGVPVSAGSGSVNVTTPDGTFSLQYDLTADPNELALIGRGGEKYNAPVLVTVTEPDGNHGRMATTTFNAVGWTSGLLSSDLVKVDGCVRKYLRRAFIRRGDWLVPPVEDHTQNELHDRINQSRLRELVRLIARQYPVEAHELSALVRIRYPSASQDRPFTSSQAAPFDGSRREH